MRVRYALGNFDKIGASFWMLARSAKANPFGAGGVEVPDAIRRVNPSQHPLQQWGGKDGEQSEARA
jgi:hypothetical protein